MKKILITGCAGYIGKIITAKFIKKGYEVVGIDNLSRSSTKNLKKYNKFKFYKIDIANPKLKKIITQNKIKNIIHLAAFINVSESEIKKNIYIENNVNKLIAFFKNMQNVQLNNFIFASTCAIFNSNQTSYEPTSTYALTKLLGENVIKFYSEMYNFNYCLLRYFNVAGADNINNLGKTSISDHLFGNIIKSIQKNKPLSIYGKNLKTKDGTCERDYIHVLDLSEFHIDILEHMLKIKKNYEINYGYKKGISTKKIVDSFNLILSKKLKYQFKEKRKGDMITIYLKKINPVVKKIHKFKYNSLKKIILSELKFNNISIN